MFSVGDILPFPFCYQLHHVAMYTVLLKKVHAPHSVVITYIYIYVIILFLRVYHAQFGVMCDFAQDTLFCCMKTLATVLSTFFWCLQV